MTLVQLKTYTRLIVLMLTYRRVFVFWHLDSSCSREGIDVSTCLVGVI